MLPNANLLTSRRAKCEKLAAEPGGARGQVQFKAAGGVELRQTLRDGRVVDLIDTADDPSWPFP